VAARDRRTTPGEKVTKGDQLIERGANRLQDLSRQAAAKGGLAAKFADDLAEDAAFLRKLKPSLIKARAKGQASTNAPTSQPTNEEPPPPPAPAAPSSPQLGARPKPKPKKKKRRGKGGGANPFLVAGAALAVGIVVAKVIDWRGHAHPRD
jgi:hypothetical protein